MHPIAFIKSLSLASGAMLVGSLSAAAALGTHWLKPPLLRWAALLAMPFVLAYCLYWSPVWRSWHCAWNGAAGLRWPAAWPWP